MGGGRFGGPIRELGGRGGGAFKMEGRFKIRGGGLKWEGGVDWGGVRKGEEGLERWRGVL